MVISGAVDESWCVLLEAVDTRCGAAVRDLCVGCSGLAIEINRATVPLWFPRLALAPGFEWLGGVAVLLLLPFALFAASGVGVVVLGRAPLPVCLSGSALTIVVSPGDSRVR